MAIDMPGQVVIKQRHAKAQRKTDEALSKASNKTSLQAESSCKGPESTIGLITFDTDFVADKELEDDKSKVSDDINSNESSSNQHGDEEREDEMTDSLLGKLNSAISNAGELSSKKLQYLDQDIADKRGLFKYTDDPNNYKKARKRLQNRESAVRSRSRKANETEDLRKETKKLKKEREAL